MSTLFISHPSCHRHEMGSWHPESPARLDAITDQLLSSGVSSYIQEVQALAASEEQILRVHDKSYIDTLQSRIPQEGYTQIDQDTFLNPKTYEAAVHAAGAGVMAVDAVMRKEADNVFCAVRPPGHHALPYQAMGFCFLNNIAIAARHAVATYGLQRIAVIDFDVHHGNGTEAALSHDPHILMCSFFQHPFFPFSGTVFPAENMLNVPVAAGAGGAEIRELVKSRWLPALDKFEPELILISAGFDGHKEDDLGELSLVEADYAWMTEEIMFVARKHAQGRIVSMLEGGYSLSALARSVTAHIRILAGV